MDVCSLYFYNGLHSPFAKAGCKHLGQILGILFICPTNQATPFKLGKILKVNSCYLNPDDTLQKACK